MMKWERLRSNKCPYCGQDLHQEGKEVKCTRCRFHISYERFVDIRSERREGVEIIQNKWQNLIDGKCPICSKLLRKKEGDKVYRCIDPECTFLITEVRMDEMIADPKSATNRYR